MFLIDLLNFSFWSPDNNKFVVSFNKKHYTGYWALCAAINRALEVCRNSLNCLSFWTIVVYLCYCGVLLFIYIVYWLYCTLCFLHILKYMVYL